MPDIAGSRLHSMAEDLARAAGRYHPGRPAFSALSRAAEAVRQAAREVADHEQRFGRSPGEG